MFYSSHIIPICHTTGRSDLSILMLPTTGETFFANSNQYSDNYLDSILAASVCNEKRKPAKSNAGCLTDQQVWFPVDFQETFSKPAELHTPWAAFMPLSLQFFVNLYCTNGIIWGMISAHLGCSNTGYVPGNSPVLWTIMMQQWCHISWHSLYCSSAFSKFASLVGHSQKPFSKTSCPAIPTWLKSNS